MSKKKSGNLYSSSATKLPGKTARFPHIGQRIGKTAIAVFLCLLLYRLLGYEGSAMRTEACITAILCMQPYVQDTGNYALNRLLGTLIGIFWGVVFLLLFYAFPAIADMPILLSAFMAFGVLLSLYSGVVLRRRSSSGLSAIVFLCIVIAFPDIANPVYTISHRVLDLMVGTVIAILVNVFHLPRVKHPEYLFFVKVSDLTPDRFSQVPPSVMFRMNQLHSDGARICLISDHAPAFFTQQMATTKLDIPLIVMDGAAIFDINTNSYVYTHMVPEDSSAWLMKELDALEIGYFVYTIHNDKTCIFHHGDVSPQENVVFQTMKRSPYRNYLEGESYEADEIIYVKVIAPEEALQSVIYQVYPKLEEHGLRVAVREQAGDIDVKGMYFYAADANVPHAEEILIDRFRTLDPTLQAEEVFSTTGYRSEHDAIRIMNRIEHLYEPTILSKLKKNKGRQ